MCSYYYVINNPNHRKEQNEQILFFSDNNKFWKSTEKYSGLKYVFHKNQ